MPTIAAPSASVNRIGAGTAVTVIAAMALNAFVIRHFYNLADANNLAYAAAIIVTGLGMCWLGNQVADAMLRQSGATSPASSERRRSQASAFLWHSSFLFRLHLLVHRNCVAARLSLRGSGIL